MEKHKHKLYKTLTDTNFFDKGVGWSNLSLEKYSMAGCIGHSFADMDINIFLINHSWGFRMHVHLLDD